MCVANSPVGGLLTFLFNDIWGPFYRGKTAPARTSLLTSIYCTSQERVEPYLNFPIHIHGAQNFTFVFPYSYTYYITSWQLWPKTDKPSYKIILDKCLHRSSLYGRGLNPTFLNSYQICFDR